MKFIALTVIENNEPIEKFVFEINSYLKNLDIPLDMILESESIYALADLEHHLRACLVKMNACPPRPSSSSTTPSPNSESSSSEPKLQSSDITFQLSIEKNQDGYPERSKSSKKDKHKEIDWIPAEITFGWKNIIPLKSVSMDLFHVSLGFGLWNERPRSSNYKKINSLILLLWNLLIKKGKNAHDCAVFCVYIQIIKYFLLFVEKGGV